MTSFLQEKACTLQCRAVESLVGPWSDLRERGPMGGLGAQPPRKILATTPSRLPENEENAPFKTDCLKKMLCQGYAKMYL